LCLVLVVCEHKQNVVEQRRVVAARRPPKFGQLGLHHLLELRRQRRLSGEVGHGERGFPDNALKIYSLVCAGF
jgi:hypothetical protein